MTAKVVKVACLWLLLAGLLSAQADFRSTDNTRGDYGGAVHFRTTSATVNDYGGGTDAKRVSASEPTPTPPLSLTNVQKLSLSPSTPVGTRVSVSDGFVVSGAGDVDGESTNGFYYANGAVGGKSIYTKANSPSHLSFGWDAEGGSWALGGDIGAAFHSTDDVAFPWLVTTWTLTGDGELPLPTLTHPAIQTLAAPSTAQGGVAVLGGTQDGVWTKDANQVATKDAFTLLGQTVGGDYELRWTANVGSVIGSGPASPGFVLVGPDTTGYYSLSDVATPDLAVGTTHQDVIAKIDFNGMTSLGIPGAVLDADFGHVNNAGDHSALIRFNPAKALTESNFNQDAAATSTILEIGGDDGSGNAPTRSAVIAQIVSISGGAITDNGDGTVNLTLTRDSIFPYDLLDNWNGTTTGIIGTVVQAGVWGHGPWLNASDDSDATITVTSVSVGEIYAGLFVSNDGATNGSSYVSQPFHGRQYYMGLGGGGSNNMHWDTDFNVWTDDVGEWTTDNVAFPWQGTDAHAGHNGATFIRNNVANERNWQVAP